jgi:hypothetical protein
MIVKALTTNGVVAASGVSAGSTYGVAAPKDRTTWIVPDAVSTALLADWASNALPHAATAHNNRRVFMVSPE